MVICFNCGAEGAEAIMIIQYPQTGWVVKVKFYWLLKIRRISAEGCATDPDGPNYARIA